MDQEENFTPELYKDALIYLKRPIAIKGGQREAPKRILKIPEVFLEKAINR